MPKSISRAFDIPTGAKSQNAEWLTTDLAVDDLGKFRFNIALDPAAKVEYTLDSGSNWLILNNDVALPARASYGFDLYVRAGDLINFRTPTVGGTTLIIGRGDSIKDEG